MTAERKTCRCGAEVQVEEVNFEGPFARMLAGLSPVCDGCQARDAEQAAERDRVEQSERAALERRRRQASCGMPRALRSLAWETVEVDPQRAAAIDGARRWADGRVRGLLLVGPIGAGKTRIAATAAWEMLGRRLVRWTSMPQLFARLGAGSQDSQRQAGAELMTGSGALVLDDLDKARPTAYGAEQVFGVIDQRMTSGAPLLVTTNLALGELAARFPEPYGEAIASRLGGYCEAFAVAGQDRRTRR